MAESVENIFQRHVTDSKTPFDLKRLSDKFRHRNTGWSIPEAFLAVLLSAATVDGDFAADEREAILALSHRSRVLNALPPEELAAINDVVNERMENRPEALEEACQTLPADMCLPVFAHCVDIVLADGELLKSEADFLEGLIPLLDLDSDHAQRVMEVLLLMNQY
ncbi:MAG: tellurite resistance TerB family protein [Maricaulaceae bacterium]|jgi:tellurite resistance protein